MTSTEKHAAWLADQKQTDATSWPCVLAFAGQRPANLPPVRAGSAKRDGIVTVKHCRDIIAMVEAHCPGSKVTRLTVDMTEWDWSNVTVEDVPYIWSGDIPGPRMGTKKEAVYNPATNCLRIWEAGCPIYENNNGTICRDRDALADCLC